MEKRQRIEITFESPEKGFRDKFVMFCSSDDKFLSICLNYIFKIGLATGKYSIEEDKKSINFKGSFFVSSDDGLTKINGDNIHKKVSDVLGKKDKFAFGCIEDDEDTDFNKILVNAIRDAKEEILESILKDYKK